MVVLSGFWYQDDAAYNMSFKVFLLFCFFEGKSLSEGFVLFFDYLVEFTPEAGWSWAFLVVVVGRFLTTDCLTQSHFVLVFSSFLS